MSLVADGIQMNVHSVQFIYTPPGGSATTVIIPEAKDLTITKGGDEVVYSGDDAPGPTHKAVVNRTRTVKLSGAARNIIAAIPQGLFGTLTWIEDDFVNGASTGSFTGTLANCSLTMEETGGEHNTVRMNDATFSSIWKRSVTTPFPWVDPLTYAIAS